MIGEDHPSSIEALAAFGKTTLRNLRLENDIQSLKCCIDQLRLELHHKIIENQALRDQKVHLVEKMAEMVEKAETRVMPIVIKPEEQDPILEADEYDLSVDVNAVARPGNDPLIL